MHQGKAFLGLGLLAILGLNSCSIYGMAGDKVSEYSLEHVAPYLMGTDDLAMGCATGEAMTGVLLSFSRVTDSPDKVAAATFLTAGLCAEFDAREHELAGLRAVKAGNSSEAQDALIAEKRAHALAAKRYYKGANHLVAAYGEIGDKCPKFEDDNDQLIYMIGLLSGLQAVLHDRASDGQVGVPLDMPSKVARAVKCLDNQKWWGMPEAIEASVWMAVPGSAPEGADAWAQFESATKIGLEKGVRLSQALQALSAQSVGKTDLLRKTIVDHAEAIKAKPADKQWQMLDANATNMIEFLSDRLWTEATGHRTPINGLGTFWDVKAEQADDDLFGDE